jgi:hypothetical protein
MTGCYPQRVSILGALGPKSNVGINDNEVLLPEIMKQRGYATAISASGTSGTIRSFCRHITASTATSACRIPTTCGPIIRRTARTIRRCR